MFSNNKIQIHDMSLIVMELLFHEKELLFIIYFTTSILFLIIFYIYITFLKTNFRKE